MRKKRLSRRILSWLLMAVMVVAAMVITLPMELQAEQVNTPEDDPLQINASYTLQEGQSFEFGFRLRFQLKDQTVGI